jgi:hypothetical protein
MQDIIALLISLQGILELALERIASITCNTCMFYIPIILYSWYFYIDASIFSRFVDIKITSLLVIVPKYFAIFYSDDLIENAARRRILVPLFLYIP